MSDTREQWTALVKQRQRAAAKPHKYGAKAKIVDGIRFASTKEAKRYQELKLLEKAGELHDLRLQQSLTLCAWHWDHSIAHVIGKYVADFVYCQCLRTPCVRSHLVYEDVKGFKTALYRWKKKHVEVQYGIQIREI